MTLATRRKYPFGTSYPYRKEGPRYPFGYVESQDDFDMLMPTELRHKGGRFSPIAVMLTGRRDAGKTYTMTVLGDLMRRRYVRDGLMPNGWPRCKDPHRAAWKIVSNYWTSFTYSGQRVIDGVIQFESWVSDMLLLMDELQTELHNRRSMGRENVGMGNFLTMIRKRRVDCVFTTQTPTQIDSNVLYQVDVFGQVTTSADKRFIDIYCYDWQGQWGGKRLSRRDWPPPLSAADWKVSLYVHNPWYYFKRYNTDEVHASHYMGREAMQRLIMAEELRSGNASNLDELRHLTAMDEVPMKQKDVEESGREASRSLEDSYRNLFGEDDD